jgi:TRAP-type mannitol/chloroaromatic compound transport system permease small subunit
MSRLIKAIDRLNYYIGITSAWLILPLILVGCYEVFARYILLAPTIWGYDIGYMITGAHFLLGGAFALREGSHIRIDVFYSRFCTRQKAIVDGFGFLVLLLPISLWLSVELGKYAIEAFQTGELSGESAWNPIIWPFKGIFFAGIFLLTLQALAEALRSLLICFSPNLEEA